MMDGLTLHSLHIGGVSMDDAERKAMRDQIVWLTQELEKASAASSLCATCTRLLIAG